MIYGYTQQGTHCNAGAAPLIQITSKLQAQEPYMLCVCERLWDRRQGSVCLADRLAAQRRSTALFSCNNAITGPGAGDTGERRQQPRHDKY